MERFGYKLLIILAVIVTLTISALAWAMPGEPAITDEEAMISDAEMPEEPEIVDDAAVITDIENPEEQALTDDEAINTDEEMSESPVVTGEDIIIRSTIEFNGKTIPLTESVKAVTNNAKFKENNWEITALESSLNMVSKAKMVDRDIALKTVLTDIQSMMVRPASDEKVSIALVEFSDLDTPTVPGTDIYLTEIPVWLVTIENVELIRRRSIPTSENDAPITALSVVFSVVDAYSGEILEVIAYGIGE